MTSLRENNLFLKCRICVNDIHQYSNAITIFCKDFLDEKIRKYLHVNVSSFYLPYTFSHSNEILSAKIVHNIIFSLGDIIEILFNFILNDINYSSTNNIFFFVFHFADIDFIFNYSSIGVRHNICIGIVFYAFVDFNSVYS